MQDRYHIQLDDRRTTVTLDIILSSFLAIKLGEVPESKAAHSAVREWLETTIKSKHGNDQSSGRVSQWIRHYAIREIAAPELEAAYVKWMI